MKQLLTEAFIKFSRISVVHSLPGRVRLHVPGLKKVPDEYKHLETELLELVTLLPGVTDLSLCFVSGRALLHYDAEAISEPRLVDWFNEVWDVLATELTNRQDLQDEKAIITHARKEIRRHIKAFTHELSG